MKKILLLLVCVFAIFGLASCDQAKVVGEWKLAEMKMDYAGVEVTIKAGESYMGIEISEDYMIMVFNADKTGTVSTQGENEDFKWEFKDGKFVLTVDEDDSETVSAYLEDDYLVLEMESMKVKFVKAK